MSRKKRTAKTDDAIPDVSGHSLEEIVGALLKVPVTVKPKKRATKKKGKKSG